MNKPFDWFATYWPQGFFLDDQTGEIVDGTGLWTDGSIYWRYVDDERHAVIVVDAEDLLCDADAVRRA